MTPIEKTPDFNLNRVKDEPSEVQQFHSMSRVKDEPNDVQFHSISTSNSPAQPEEPTTVSNNYQQDNSKKPQWIPTKNGRSIVWEHITYMDEGSRVSCNYCPAEFQIKGGTSAVLRHLKVNHPVAIDFDPENPPPVKRKNKKQEDTTIISEDTRSYMDNLLMQFLPNGEGEGPCDATAQARADSEIDEVIRTLREEEKEPTAVVCEQDPDFRKLLGLYDDQPPVVEDIGVSRRHYSGDMEKEKEAGKDESLSIPSTSTQYPSRFTTQLSQSYLSQSCPNGGPSPKKRREDLQFAGKIHGSGKLPILLKKPSIPPPPTTSGGMKYNGNSFAVLEFEAKVLYNQSMHSTIAREDAMARYYRMKTRKMELEVKMMEKNLGITRETTPDDHRNEQE